MAAFTNDDKLSGQTPISYNQAGVAYDASIYIYNGKQPTVWTYDTKN